MALKELPILDMTKDSLYQLIAMSPVALGRNTLLGFFDSDAKTRARIDSFLAELTLEDRVKTDDHGYRAIQPWADVAYAHVGSIQTRGRTPVKILNFNGNIPPQVTLSRQDVYKNKLNEGDKIVIGLNRDNNGGPELKARFIDHVEAGKNFRLTGIFNQKAHVFTALDRKIKAEFTLDREPVDSDVPRQFVAELKTHFDIRKPVLTFVPDQSRDMTTGDVISQIILRKHKISDSYPEDVLHEAERIARRPLRLGKSMDLRMLDFVTVDPLGALDLDDCAYAEAYGDGYALYTGIADVARMVHYKGKVDRDAYERGTTFYLRAHTAHMLPPVLGIEKLSLNPGEDRHTIMLRQILGPEGEMKSFDFFPAIVKSRQQLSYEQFYEALRQYDPRFTILAKIQELRRCNGFDKDLDLKLRSGDKFASKSMIETLMVQYNSLMAEYLNDRGIPYISRNFVQDTDQKNPVRRAYYSSQSLGHGNLGMKHYAHGSSPLRRYADLFNQRAMHTAFGFGRTGLHKDEIASIDIKSTHLNGRRDVETDVAHDEEKYHGIRYLQGFQDSPPIRVNIQDIGEDYVDIVIMQTGHRQRLNESLLPANQWKIDRASHQLILLDENGGSELHRYNRTDTLLGQIHSVDPQSACWQVALIPQDRYRPTPAPKKNFG